MEYILVLWFYGTGAMSSNIPPYPDKQSCEEAGGTFAGKFWQGKFVCIPHPKSEIQK
jgi:energy-converting hydrogenase Eha subunit B